MEKRDIGDLAIFNGPRAFPTPVSTSNLLRPDIDAFLAYSRVFYDQRQYTNNGPNVRLLEARLAEFHEVKHCITFCSGFWGMVLAIKALALEGRDEIIMPSLTYRRMPDIAAWVPLKPRFCEVDPDTLAMTPETVAECINDNTALILGAHPIVNCCDAKGLVELSRERGIPILFDSVESVYESLEEGRIGGFGAAEAFSMHACKLINGFGGGYVTTNDPVLARKLALMRGFGFDTVDHIAVPDGLNAKLNEMHAAMALASLDDVEAQVERNRERYYAYKRLLETVRGVRLVEFDERFKAGFKNIVVELTPEWPLSRAHTIAALNAEGVLARAYYAPALHMKAMDFPYVPAKLPLTEELAERFVNMPCGHRVNVDDIGEIVRLLSFLSENARSVADRLTSN